MRRHVQTGKNRHYRHTPPACWHVTGGGGGGGGGGRAGGVSSTTLRSCAIFRASTPTSTPPPTRKYPSAPIPTWPPPALTFSRANPGTNCHSPGFGVFNILSFSAVIVSCDALRPKIAGPNPTVAPTSRTEAFVLTGLWSVVWTPRLKPASKLSGPTLICPPAPTPPMPLKYATVFT